MSKEHCRFIVTACVPLFLAFTFFGCGGTSSQNSTPPPKPASKFLYATAQNGILGFTIDPATGALSNPTSTPGPSFNSNPSYGIVGDPKQGLLYVADLGKHQVDAFAVTNSTGLLTPGSSFAFPPLIGLAGPLGLAIDPRGRFLFGTGEGTLLIRGGTDVFTIDSTSGNLTVVSGSPFQNNDGVFMAVDPSGKFLFELDGLNNAVIAYAVDSNAGILTPVPGSPFRFSNQSNWSPLSLVEDSTGSFVFVVVSFYGAQCYQSVWSFAVEPSGALTVGPSPSFQFGDPSNCTPIDHAIATSGSFVYVTDLHGVHALSVAPATGVLTEVTGSPFPPGTDSGGLTVTADGKFLYEASPSSNTINVFAINPTTGALSPVGQPEPAGTGPLILTLY